MAICKRLWINDRYYIEFHINENKVSLRLYKDGFEYPCLLGRFALYRGNDNGIQNAIYMYTIDELMECINKIVHILYLNLNHKEYNNAIQNQEG